MDTPGVRAKRGGNTSTADTWCADAIVWEGYKYRVYTYSIKHPEPQKNQAPCWGVIVVFVIMTPQIQGVESHAEWAQVGSFRFIYISNTQIYSF